MRHAVRHRKLGRTSSHRLAMLRNQLASLVTSERIVTTLPKAKELRPIAERVITQGKRGTVHARRMAQRWIADRTILKKLFDEIAPRLKDRDGGYLRIVKLGQRQGDAAEVAILEFVDFVYVEKAPKAEKATAKADAPETSDDEGGEEKPKKKAATKADGDKPKKAAKPAKAPVAKADSKSKGGAKKGSTPRKAGSS
jgi:large subunit ribosomal protein L17